jgi:two-component system, chemotaxis family, sensor kinase CheA
MEQFKKKFLEEAQDLINSLEETLLVLEENKQDKKIIQEVFRIMHSLKGGSAMFGFHKMDAFTHDLETIYDLIRNDQLDINSEIVDVTLSAVDHLKMLLLNGEELSAKELTLHVALLERINSIVNERADGVNEKVDKEALISNDKIPGSSQGQAHILDFSPTYYIYLNPGEDIFKNGTNPLFLVDELNALGHCKAFPKTINLPDIDKLDPEKCYCKWELILSTDKTEDDIRDIFIFVEDECEVEITKLSDTNLLANNSFSNSISDLVSEEGLIDKVELNRLIDSVIKSCNNEEQLAFREVEPGSSFKKNIINNIRVDSDKLDNLMNLVSELVTTQASLSLFAENQDNPELIAIAENIEKISRQLRDNTFEICLIPIETIMVRFKRLVRDLSSELNKEIQFVAEGTETELDKSIIEGLTDPLMHIFRNAIDHGIESGDERVRRGKPRQGKIVLKAYYSGTNVYLQIKDDGSGIDVEKIRQKAISRGFISSEANLSYKELLNLVFLPGFSTAAKVTEVSGRGVGLDVVVKKISDIRGEVEIESKLGVGTTITIKLPLTLSIIDGLLVKVDSTFFVLPLSSVDKCFEISDDKITNAFNNKIVLDGKQVPFVHLRNEFRIEENNPHVHQVVQVNHDNFKIGLTVDTIIGEYQAVLKPLGKMYKDIEIVSGATILGDGTIALVLDPARIINTFDRENMLKREKMYRELSSRIEA